jgi:hypothetical protein
VIERARWFSTIAAAMGATACAPSILSVFADVSYPAIRLGARRAIFRSPSTRR